MRYTKCNKCGQQLNSIARYSKPPSHKIEWLCIGCAVKNKYKKKDISNECMECHGKGITLINNMWDYCKYCHGNGMDEFKNHRKRSWV